MTARWHGRVVTLNQHSDVGTHTDGGRDMGPCGVAGPDGRAGGWQGGTGGQGGGAAWGEVAHLEMGETSRGDRWHVRDKGVAGDIFGTRRGRVWGWRGHIWG